MTGSPDRVDEEAAAWLALLQGRTVSTEELEQFASWRKSPGHAAAYERAQALWEASAKLSNDPDIQRALHRQEIGIDRRRSVFVSHPALMLTAIAAAILLIITVMSVRSVPDTGGGTFRTATGERSEVRLADGSKLQLDTDSQVDPRFEADERRVALVRGQAFFQVAHDDRRPFVVDAGDGITVTATGTEFDVSRVDERVRVALSSGGVVVRREGADLVRMSPGDVIEVAVNNGLVPTRRTLAETISWRSGHLSFNATPLSQAVAEMNRYTDTKLRIVDGESRNEPVSGEFDVDDPKGFARAVNALLGSDTIAG